MRFELQGAQGMCDPLDGVAVAVREIIQRVYAPFVTSTLVRMVTDTINNRIAHVDVGGSHVDPGPQHVLAVGKLPGFHSLEKVPVLGDIPIPVLIEHAQLDDGGAFTDYTTEARESTVDDVPLLPAAPAVNDAFYFGASSPFAFVDLDISTPAINVLDLEKSAEEAPVVRLVNLVLVDAIKKGCSDIHIEPYEKEFRVRMRIDGALYEVMKPPLKLKNAVISRIKIMSSLDIAERRLPQDGKIVFASRFSYIGDYWYDDALLQLNQEFRMKLLET